MNRIVQSAFYGLLVTIYGTSIYYALGVLFTLSQGGDVVQFFAETVKSGIFFFLIMWLLFYELTGAFERLNKEGSDKDKNKPDKDQQS